MIPAVVYHYDVKVEFIGLILCSKSILFANMKTVVNTTPALPTPLVISGRRIFSVQPAEPPSSPPPASPLPPLPDAAPYRPRKRCFSSSPLPRTVRVHRPPRTQTSVPNLTSLIVKYQRPSLEDCCKAVTNLSSSSSQRYHYVDRNLEKAVSAESQKQSRIRLLTSSLQSSDEFTEDVLSALPQLFQQLPTKLVEAPGVPKSCCHAVNVNLNSRSQQLYGKIANICLAKEESSSETVEELLARSPLFIPNVSTLRPHPCRGDIPRPYKCSLNDGASRNAEHLVDEYSRALTASPLHHSFTDPSNVFSWDDNSNSTRLPSHKRSNAVTTWAFDFDPYSQATSASTTSENLNSLPKLPSDPTVYNFRKPNTRSSKPRVRFSGSVEPDPTTPPRRASDQITFLSMPYSDTLFNQGPPPRIAVGNRAPQFKDEITTKSKNENNPLSRTSFSTRLDPEASEHETEEALTEEELRQVKRRRLLWALLTIMLVLIATTGILCGIIWKLISLAQ